ncbi:hypothetical protein [Azospirillum largimobile]
MDGCCFSGAPYHGICSHGIGGMAGDGTIRSAGPTRAATPSRLTSACRRSLQ